MIQPAAAGPGRRAASGDGSAVQGPAAPPGRPAARDHVAGARAGSGRGRVGAAATARRAARPAACGPASSSCKGAAQRGRRISARPSGVKPSRRGRAGSVARPAAGRAPARRAACGMPARVDQDGAGQVAQAIWRASAGSAARLAASCGAAFGRGGGGRPPVHVDGGQRRRGRDAGAQAAGQRPGMDRASTAASSSSSKARTSVRRSPKPGAGGEHGGSSTGSAPGRRPPAAQRRGPGASRPAAGRGLRRGGQPGPLPPCAARVMRTASSVALASPGGAVAVGQEALVAADRDEGAGHGRDPGGDPAAMQVAQPVRGARAPERVVRQRVVLHRRDPDLARAQARAMALTAPGSRVRAAAAPSRTAAGRPRRSSCPTARARRRRQALDGVAARLAAPFAAVEIGGFCASVSRAKTTVLSDSRAERRRRARPGAMAVSTWWRRPDSRSRQARAWSAVSAFGRMRRPTATTVSAASTKRPARAARRPFRAPGARRAARQLVAARRLVDVLRGDAVGDDADLGQQRQAARAGRGEDQRGPAGGKRGYLNRKVIRPLDRS